jgi:hypothetical protein
MGIGMAYCTKCGMQNDDDAVFCKQCGASIAAPSQPPEPKQPPGSAKKAAAAPSPPATPPPPVPGRRYDHDKDWDDRCEEECTGGKGRYSWIWGALIILLGIWIIFEFGVKNIEGVPEWIKDFEFWWILPVLFGLLLILVGLDTISRMSRYR